MSPQEGRGRSRDVSGVLEHLCQELIEQYAKSRSRELRIKKIMDVSARDPGNKLIKCVISSCSNESSSDS